MDFASEVESVLFFKVDPLVSPLIRPLVRRAEFRLNTGRFVLGDGKSDSMERPMKLVRFASGARGSWGVVEGDRVEEIRGDLFAPGAPTGRTCPLDELKILPPSDPGKIVIIARNYVAHAAELKNEVPTEPIFVCVSPQAALAHGEPIRYIPGVERIDYEAELVAMIGKVTQAVEEKSALGHVAGYTCGLDISNRDMQFGPLKNISGGKSYDTFKPFGPFVETKVDPQALRITMRQNGEVRQQGNTSQMIFPVARLVSAISKCMTLLPGDVIFTGTPSGVGPIAVGDVLEVEISSVGTLRNPVVKG